MFQRYIVICFKLALVSANILAITEKQYARTPPIFHLDNYDRCMLHGENALYCVIVFRLYPINSSNEIWNTIKEANSPAAFYKHDILSRGVCFTELFPNESSSVTNIQDVRQKITQHFNDQYRPLELMGDISSIRCESNESEFKVDFYNRCFAVLFIGYCTVIILGTLVYELRYNEGKSKGQAPKQMKKFLAAISLRNNWRQLMTIDFQKADVRKLRCLQGFRFYGIIYTVLIHRQLLHFTGFVANTYKMEKMHQRRNIVFDGSHVMQIFFMLSTFLQCYNFFTDTEKGVKIDRGYFIKAIVKRYVRLTPTLLLTVAFGSSWMAHVSRGPHWHVSVGHVHILCRKNGWTNILYLNNIINKEEMCFLNTWYLAVNTQFYILCFIPLYLMWKYPRKVVHVLSTMVFIQVAGLFWVIHQNNWPFMYQGLEFMRSLRSRTLRFDDPSYYFLHMSLFANMGGVITGLTCGYLFCRYKNKTWLYKKVHVIFWWIIAIGVPVMIVYFDTVFDSESKLYNALYGSVRRLIFTAGNGVLLMGIIQGQGGFLKWLHEAVPIYILGKLSFSVYIIHQIFQYIGVGEAKALNEISSFTALDIYLGDVVICFIGALFVTLFVEMPIIALEKEFFRKQSVHEEKKTEELQILNKNN